MRRILRSEDVAIRQPDDFFRQLLAYECGKHLVAGEIAPALGVLRKRQTGDVGKERLDALREGGDLCCGLRFLGQTAVLVFDLLRAHLGVQRHLRAVVHIRRQKREGLGKRLHLVPRRDRRRDIVDEEDILRVAAVFRIVLYAVLQVQQRVRHLLPQPRVHQADEHHEHGDQNGNAVQQELPDAAVQLLDGFIRAQQRQRFPVARAQGLDGCVKHPVLGILFEVGDLLHIPIGPVLTQRFSGICLRRFQQGHIVLARGKFRGARRGNDVDHDVFFRDHDIKVFQRKIVDHAVEERLHFIISRCCFSAFHAAAKLIGIEIVFDIADDLVELLVVLIVQDAEEKQIEKRAEQYAKRNCEQDAGAQELAAHRFFHFTDPPFPFSYCFRHSFSSKDTLVSQKS